jgi:hypothetical protein
VHADEGADLFLKLAEVLKGQSAGDTEVVRMIVRHGCGTEGDRMASPAHRLRGRKDWTLGIALLTLGLLAIAVTSARADANHFTPAGDKRAIVGSTVVIVPFMTCPTCPLPALLTGMQVDPGDAVKVHTAFAKTLAAEVYASVTGGRATMTQLADKPSRLDVVELYGSNGLLAQAVRAADGSYEVASRQPSSPVGQSGASRPTFSQWGTKIVTDPADGSQSVFLATRSVGSVLEGTGDDMPGILSVRCLRGKVSAMISWPRFLGLRKGQNIEWRLDAAPWVTEYWAFSADGRALQGPWSAPFLKQLYAAKQLVVRVTPYGMPSQTLEFRVDGLEADAAPLREACKVK